MLELLVEAFQRGFRGLASLAKTGGLEDVGGEQPAQRGETVDVRALVAVGGVAAERQQRGAGVVAGGDRRLRVAVVVAEQVAAQGDVVALAEPQQVPRQMEVVSPPESCMATLTLCSLEFWPSATGAMSMPTNSLTSQGRRRRSRLPR